MTFITTKQAADILGLAENTVRTYIIGGDILGQKTGSVYAVDKASVLAFKAKRDALDASKKANRPRIDTFHQRVGNVSPATAAKNAAEWEEKFEVAKAKWLEANR